MKVYIKRFLKKRLKDLDQRRYRKENRAYIETFERFKEYSMIPCSTYVNNLLLTQKFKGVEGAVVECGTWRGGMIAGMAALLGSHRNYFLYDSFEGLPEAKEIDGQSAVDWQNNKQSPGYYDNCKAEMALAEKAMSLSGAKQVNIIKGWFSDTLPGFDKSVPIAILRLDGDWYESTMDCLQNLYDAVVPGGVIILDDYFTWDGCTRAVHDFLSERKLSDKVRQWHDDRICYIVKEGKTFTKGAN